MRVVVFGATGFIGGAIARRFVREGAEVHATARDDESAAALEAAGMRVFDAQLGDPSALAKAAEGCSHAIHAAGIRDRRAARKVLGWAHVAGTENVISACRHVGIRRLTHISCADVTLSAKPRVNWNEDRVLPSRGFDAHAETVARAEESVIGAGGGALTTVVLRPAFVWGPGGDTKSSWGTSPEIVQEGIKAGLPLYSKGERFVGVSYIENVAQAAWLTTQHEGAAGSVFHIVDAEMALAGEFFRSLSEALDLPPPRRGAGLALSRALAWFGRLGGGGTLDADILRRAQSHSFDSSRARDQLAYVPEVSQADGMKALSAWALSRGGKEVLAGAVKPTPAP